MNDLVLTLAICWLEAEDAFAAACVSVDWGAALSGDRDNVDMWKQVNRNSFPLLARRVHNDSEMNHRLLALGMWGGKVTTKKRTTIYTPTLRPEQVFAVVDLYRMQTVPGNSKRQKDMIASWVCPLSSNKRFIDMNFTGDDDDKNEKIMLKGPNPYSFAGRDSREVQNWMRNHPGTVPHMFTAADTFQVDKYCEDTHNESALRVNVTLFRRDTMQSIRILENYTYIDGDGSDTDTEVSYSMYGKDVQVKLGVDNAGNVSRAMLYETGFSHVTTYAKVCLSSKLPLPGSDEEPRWLANVRHRHALAGDDIEALASIPHFEFQVAGFYISLLKSKDIDQHWSITNPNEMMVLLEGLHWE
jgi:hypothetical protein